MATAVTMPKLGLTMTRGLVAKWLVQDGQEVEQGTFIGRWAHELIFVDCSQEVLTICYCLFAALVIGMFVIIPPRRPRFLSRDS